MHSVKPIFVFALALLGTNVCGITSIAQADVKDLGEACITLSYDNVGAPPLTHRFGVVAYGSHQQYAVLTGALGTSPATGAAILVGDTVTITYTTSNVSGSFLATSTTQIVLNASTLTGTVATVTTQLSPSPVSTKLLGTAIVVACN